MNRAAGLHEETHGIPPDVYHRRWFILALLNLSLVTVVIAVSSLNVALPTIARELDATTTELQWIVDAYALVFAGFLLPAGALGDRFGRKGALQVGLVVFGGAALAATFATSPTTIVMWRTVMGIGAALIMPATLSIILNVFPLHERPKAIAVWAGFAAVGGAIGPVSSGLLLEHFWWGSVFFVNIPLVVVLLVLSAPFLPRSSDPSHTALDPPGALLSIVALVSLVFAIIEGPEQGWTAPLTLGAFALAAVSLAAFVAWELRSDRPMLDPRLLRVRGFSMGSLTITISFFAMFGMFFIFTMYLQFVKGYTALEAGIRTLPFSATMIVVAPRGPRIVARFGVRRVVLAGFLITAVGFAAFATFRADTPYWFIGLTMIPLAAGVALSMPPASQLIVNSLPLAKAGVGSAVNDVTREVGGALGIAVLGSIVASVYRSSIEPAAESLPPGVRERVTESIGGAAEAMARGDVDAASVHSAVASAFTDATTVAWGVSAGVMVVAGFVISRLIPDRLPGLRHRGDGDGVARDDGAVPEPAPAPASS